jgi:hypothetical protein
MGVFGIKTDVLINTLKGVVMVRYLSSCPRARGYFVPFADNKLPLERASVPKQHNVKDTAELALRRLINWHPVNGMSLEERALRMKADGITEPEEVSTFTSTV